MKDIVFLLCVATLCCLYCFPAAASAEISPLAKAKEFLVDRNYADALGLLDDLAAQEDAEHRDEIFFLAGNACFYQQNYEAALTRYAEIAAEMPDSVWKAKALFKQAECYAELGQFDEAEHIYEQEVIHLVSPERKEEIAQIYLDFAEEYFSGKWVRRQKQQIMEERPDYSRAKTFYELALQMELGKSKEEAVRFQIARCAYQSGNYAEAVQVLQDLQTDYPAGALLTDTVFSLGQAYLKQGQLLQARKLFRDFLEDFPDDPNAPEAAFLLSRAYNIPNPASAEELDLGVNVLRDVIEIYPQSERAAQAEYEIGLSYYHYGRYDAAVDAFSAYLEKYEKNPAQEGTTPDTLPQARYALGNVYQRQRKFDEALAVWADFLRKYPADRQWNEVQRQMIATEDLIADKLFREERYAEARAAWEDFLRKHPLDERNAEIMYRIGDTFARESEAASLPHATQKERCQEAVAQWKRAVSKYPGTEAAGKAQYDIGQLFETRLRQFEEAFAAYKLVTWSSYSAQAQERIREMQAKRLSVLTERAFRTDETPTLKVTTRNIESLTFKMYRVDLETYFRKMHSVADVDDLDIALIDPDKTWQIELEAYERFREFERDVVLPFTEPGAYLVTCSEDNVKAGETGYEATTLALISDLDIIVKTTKRDVLVFAQNMRSGAVYPNVKFLLSDGGKIFAEPVSGQDGVFHAAFDELKELADLRVFAYDGAHYASNMLDIGGLRYVVGLQARGFLYSDRPAYRPGQQAHLRGIIRAVDAQGVLRVPASEGTPETPYNFSVLNSQGTPIYQENVTLNAFGSFAADFDLSASSVLGTHRMLLTRGKESYSGDFLVEPYTREQLKLKIETEREVYFRGETITGTISAEYYYGAPFKAKPISYTAAHLPTQSGVTDEHGQLEFSFSTRDFAESQTITINARLDDQPVQISKTVWLATRGFECDVSTLRNVYLVNEDINVKVAANDPAGAAVQQTLTLGVFKRETTPYGDTAEVKVDAREITTDADGGARTTLRLQNDGAYILRAEGRDRFDNPISAQTEVFISGKDDEIKLRLIADSEEFNVGEKPQIDLFSRAKAGLGLLTYEGDAILSYQIIPIQPQHNPLTLDIGSALAPNFTLAVAQMQGNRFHQAQKEFSVMQGLNLALEVKKVGEDETVPPSGFQPGDRIEVHLSATDQNGLPVAAEISLAMVDEALFAQYADRLPPMRDVFYDQRRGLLSATDTSCTFSFEAETVEIVTELVEEDERFEAEMELAEMVVGDFEFADSVQSSTASRKMAGAIPLPMKSEMNKAMAPPSLQASVDAKEKRDEFLTALRDYFPETGYWNPAIVTDAQGKAVVTFDLPDSTTEWRFTARGISRETLVGEITSALKTSLPFFADMKVPAVFTEGDRVFLLADLHNYSGSQQETRLAFRAALEGKTLERQEQQFQVKERSVLETVYRLDLAQITPQAAITPLSLELTANADGFQDRIKRDVPVRLWGIEYVAAKSGALQNDRSVTIALPGDRQYVTQEMRILLNPALDRTLLDLTEDAPWPVKAPRCSSIHEALIILNALNSVEASFAAGEKRKLDERLRALLIEIGLQQNQDGGWNWTGTKTRSDLFVSADAMIALTQAQKQGYAVRKDVRRNGLNYLQRQFQAAQDNELKTALLYALTLTGEVDFAHVNRVYRERNSLKTPGLAFLTLIYHELQRPEIAQELLALLQQRAKRERDQASGAQTAYWPSDSAYPRLQDQVETTALALLAVQEVAPNSPLIPAAIEWLYSQRRWVGWGSMRVNARVSAALRQYLATVRHADDRYRLSVGVNGETVETLTVNAEQGARVLHIASHLLKQSDNTVTFDFEGRGSLNYVCVLKGVSRDVRKTDEHYDVRRVYEPAPLVYNGKEIQRGFSVLSGSYSTWRNALTQIPFGGFARVTLEFHRREFNAEQPYANARLILEEPIPAGCRVLDQSIQGQLLDYDLADGKIIFYLNNARYGTVSYDLYGYLPGDFKVLPTSLRDPYRPERVDYGEPYGLSVLKRGDAVTEEYKKTPDELYYLGKALFEDKRHAEARPLLQRLFDEYRLDATPYRDTARMLMYIAIAEQNSRDIVAYFEILKEKFPDLVLSFEDIIRVGQAYRDIHEYERAAQVFKATAEASFLKDVQVSGTLEAQGEFLSSVEYTKNLIADYPDMPVTETSFYALAQLLSTEAERMRRQPADYREAAYSRKELLQQTIAMFYEFLVRYPQHPIVDEVGFSLVNAYIDLDAFATVVDLARRFQQRYPQSPYFSGYQYIEAYSDFELERYDEALRLCRTVANSKYPNKQGKPIQSGHRNPAIYIMGQIYHSLRQPEQAIAEYERVKKQFPDAREAIAYFTRKALKLEEISTFQTGEEVRVTLHYRNIKQVNLLVYRVDLMKLYLLRKNLNNITNINLAGITPYHQENLTLGDGKDYAEKTHELSLPLETEGAYLIVAKADELDTSGMALLSQLALDVEEDALSGRVRVNVLNTESGRYENKVHVKTIGSGDTEFVSGSTDLRGIFIADNIHGTATVIARKGDQYAFYRGKAALQTSDDMMQRPMLRAPANMRSQATQQLRETNLAIQQQSGGYLRKNLYQNTLKGVEVQSTY